MKKYEVLNNDCYCQECGNKIKVNDFVYHIDDNRVNICKDCCLKSSNNIEEEYAKIVQSLSTEQLADWFGRIFYPSKMEEELIEEFEHRWSNDKENLLDELKEFVKESDEDESSCEARL